MYCDTINYQMVYTYKDNLNENSLKYSYIQKAKTKLIIPNLHLNFIHL